MIDAQSSKELPCSFDAFLRLVKGNLGVLKVQDILAAPAMNQPQSKYLPTSGTIETLPQSKRYLIELVTQKNNALVHFRSLSHCTLLLDP